MKLYHVLGDIAYEAGRDEKSGNAIHATASKGEIVQLNAKDAAALLARGDVVFHAESPVEVLSVTPSNWPPALAPANKE